MNGQKMDSDSSEVERPKPITAEIGGGGVAGALGQFLYYLGIVAKSPGDTIAEEVLWAFPGKLAESVRALFFPVPGYESFETLASDPQELASRLAKNDVRVWARLLCLVRHLDQTIARYLKSISPLNNHNWGKVFVGPVSSLRNGCLGEAVYEFGRTDAIICLPNPEPSCGMFYLFDPPIVRGERESGPIVAVFIPPYWRD
jgi:hypothetical protein